MGGFAVAGSERNGDRGMSAQRRIDANRRRPVISDIAMHPGASGLLVIDVDYPEHAPDCLSPIRRREPPTRFTQVSANGVSASHDFIPSSSAKVPPFLTDQTVEGTGPRPPTAVTTCWAATGMSGSSK